MCSQAMCRDYYTLDFMDRSVDTSPIAPALAEFFDDVLDRSVSQLNFKVLPNCRLSSLHSLLMLALWPFLIWPQLQNVGCSPLLQVHICILNFSISWIRVES